MATFIITTGTDSFDVTKDGETREYPFNDLRVDVDDLDIYTLSLYNINSKIIDYNIYTNTDTINVNGTTSFANAEALKTSIDSAIFNSSGESVDLGLEKISDEEGTKYITRPTVWTDESIIDKEYFNDNVFERPNLLLFPTEFGNAGWLKARITVVDGGVVSPIGDMEADKIIQTTDTGPHTVIQTIVPSIPSGTQSVYAKMGELRYIQISSQQDVKFVNFDLFKGEITRELGATGTIEFVGNGWYRISATLPTNQSLCYNLITDGQSDWLESFTGSDNTSGLYLWGAKFEDSPELTGYEGYIPVPFDPIYNNVEYNENIISEFVKKYNTKEVDENNQLNIVMTGDSIFGRLSAVDGVTDAPDFGIGEFPPNMPQQYIAYKLLEQMQYNNADVNYYNLQSSEWTQSGTWTKVTNIDEINVYESNTVSDYVEITVTGCKFFKLVYSTLGSKTLNGVSILVNGVLPSVEGLTGADSISTGTADVKWANLVWSGLDEATSYTFRFTKNNGAYASIWGCETWSKPRINIINSGHGGFTATDHNTFAGLYVQNEYYNTDLLIHELPLLNDSYGLVAYGGDVVSPSDARAGGTTEFYFIKASEDGTYTNFDGIVLKEGEIASINSSGVYVLGSIKYDEYLDTYRTQLNEYLKKYSDIDIPVLISTVHRVNETVPTDRWWALEYLDYSKKVCAQYGFGFTDLFQKCIIEDMQGDYITADGAHLNNNGVEYWANTLMETLDFTPSSVVTTSGTKKTKESGYVDAVDSRTVTFAIPYKEAPIVNISQIGGSNIYIDSISESGFVANGAGSFNWTVEV